MDDKKTKSGHDKYKGKFGKSEELFPPLPITMDHVMAWAFNHPDLVPGQEAQDLNIMRLLDKTASTISFAIDEMEKEISMIVYGGDQTGKLSGPDRDWLKNILNTEKQPSRVTLFSRELMEFMNNLYRRNSTIAPPWRE